MWMRQVEQAFVLVTTRIQCGRGQMWSQFLRELVNVDFTIKRIIMKTRGRFSAKFKAKVALEALRDQLGTEAQFCGKGKGFVLCSGKSVE
jgi:hypothetical protein